MSEAKIRDLYENVGVQISAGQVSNLLIKGQEQFHAEKEEVCEAGLSSTPWQHTDQTSTRVDGQNQHCNIVCTALYTIYTTTPKKDRLSVLDVLRPGRERHRGPGRGLPGLREDPLGRRFHPQRYRPESGGPRTGCRLTGMDVSHLLDELNEAQREAAERSKAELERTKPFPDPIVSSFPPRPPGPRTQWRRPDRLRCRLHSDDGLT